MADVTENKVTVLSLTDPNLPEFLDFKNLRKEGLKHIGDLAGKIWTDHNVHDPGITILEVLIYALMDLGYKTNLPFEDLITPESISDKDDNFLTPSEILTVNPVTITDYRKLVTEVHGVRNAWLEPTNQEVPLFIDANQNKLNCKGPQYSSTQKCIPSDNHPFMEVHLNGIYKVYIEKDTDLIKNKNQHNQLIQDVKELLAAHRNLCEDFKDEICLLKPLEIGVCAEVEVAEGFTPEKVYAQIIIKIREFIQPQITHYTLNTLLDKGKTIDDIFAGRPYMHESYGFIDTEELEALKRRKEIHLSDLYTIILSVEGVLRVKKVHIKGGLKLNTKEFCKKLAGNVGKWETGIQIANDEVPVFSLEATCIDLYSKQGFIPLNTFKIQQGFSFLKKFHLPVNELNTQVPSGKYRPDLGDYESIQTEFPVVYGIGDDGFPEKTSLLRKTQALQLKGYLTFYDQMLANYASQMTHIRSLFSLTPETDRLASEKHTYFTQIAETIPGLEHLLKLYQANEYLNEGTRLAIPVARNEAWDNAMNHLKKNPSSRLKIANYCDKNPAHLKIITFKSAAIRAIYIEQVIDSFFNENYTIEILTDRGGYFFTLCPELPADTVFVGLNRFSTFNEALNDAKNVAFLSGLKESYNIISDLSSANGANPHYFNLNYSPLSYLDIIQNLTEGNSEYLVRRKQFLDHLLARFGEEFTDYTILQYQNMSKNDNLDQQTINDQSAYINQFAEISRNRARAFNYLEPSWNTDNVSGFEKRMSLLAGFDNYNRRNLCNFEVAQCFRLQLKDASNSLLFTSSRSFDTTKELHHAANKMLANLRHPSNYNRLEKELNDFNSEVVHRIFSIKPAEENIVVVKKQYHHQLLNTNNESVLVDKKVLGSEKAALDKKDDFITRINTRKIGDIALPKYRLLPINETNYLNTEALDYEIKTLISWKWHAHDIISNKKVKSELLFEHENDAWNHLIEETETQKYLTTHATNLQWKLIIKGNITLEGANHYPDKNRSVAAWRQAKTLGSNPKNYTFHEKEDQVILKLNNEKGSAVATSNPLPRKQLEPKVLIEECVSILSNRNTKPKYEKSKEKYGFSIPDNTGNPVLTSYSSYNSKREALEQLGRVFSLGLQKKNYLKSGDEGNPEYNFILRDESEAFLALRQEELETASDRDKALTASVEFLKKNNLPVNVKEEPRRYVWCLSENEKTILESDSEFPSKAKAQDDFDKRIIAEAIKNTSKLLAPHVYTYAIISKPSRYGFIYGTTDEQGLLDPIFKGNNTYTNHHEAVVAYTDFAKKLPALQLKTTPKKEDGGTFKLFEKGQKKPIAIQFTSGKKKASVETAKAVTSYIKEIYTPEGNPRPRYIKEAIAQHPQGKYEWRFYKKNAPIARSPYNCLNTEMAEFIKFQICDVIPPITLKECPPKKKVVCPAKNPDKYHYQVCFRHKDGREFVLISFKGYNTYDEAKVAWEANWLEIIHIARDIDNYGPNGKIRLEELYMEPDSSACESNNYIAVVPDTISAKLGSDIVKIKEFYLILANLFPIFHVQDLPDAPCNNKYVYRVIVEDSQFLNTDCKNASLLPYKGSLLWESTACFDTSAEAISAYQHFYTLAGIPNNCRILCEKGNFYVGLVEVMVESLCAYESEEEAWDDAFPDPKSKDECNGCIPKGVREFIYAAEDCKNFIPFCDTNYWKFKVVAPEYFVVDHQRYYDSELERDRQLKQWMQLTTALNYEQCISKVKSGSDRKDMVGNFLNLFVSPNNSNDEETYCDYIEDIRNCLSECQKEKSEDEQAEEALRCLKEKFKDDYAVSEFLNHDSLNTTDTEKNGLTEFIKVLSIEVSSFPIYKTEEGYCYKIFLPSANEEVTMDGLQPCGCDTNDKVKATIDIVAFVSSNYYDCCEEAKKAFLEFCSLIRDGLLTPECTEKTPYGPYSFTLVNTSKVIGYHPQQYECAQDVCDAIEETKACVTNTGMHLLEHILLRPKETTECLDAVSNANDRQEKSICCLLPICPDYCCDLEWLPDQEKDEPCLVSDLDKLFYLPGSDPYSFWATIVLPAWDKRFRTQESRKAFELLLYKEVPALVGLNILWLSPRDLCKFEDVYRKWLEWKQNPKDPICNPNGVSPNCLMADCIKHLSSEDPCPTIPGATGDCQCKPIDDETYDSCCLPPETVDTLFWGYCPPVQGQPESDIPGATATFSTILNVATEATDTATKAKENKIAKEKKATTKKTVKKTDDKKLLALVRKRNPQYLANVAKVADETMMKSKSYERILFFLKNKPTIHEYGQLVNFLDENSLHEKNNKAGYSTLIKNATWHLLDTIVLNKQDDINKKDLASLEESLQKLKTNGLPIAEIRTAWNEGEIKDLINLKKLSLLENILK